MKSVRKELREVKRQLIELKAFEDARYNSLVEGQGMEGCRQWVVWPRPYQVYAYVIYRLVDTGRRDEMEREMGFDPDSERALESEHAATLRRLIGEGRPDSYYSLYHPEAEERLHEIYGERLEPYDAAVRVRKRGLLARWNAGGYDIRRRAEVWSAGRWAASYDVVDSVWEPPDGVPRTRWSWGGGGRPPPPTTISSENWLWLGVPDDELLRGSIPLPSWSGVAEAMTDEDVERERWCLEAVERLEERGERRRLSSAREAGV